MCESDSPCRGGMLWRWRRTALTALFAATALALATWVIRSPPSVRAVGRGACFSTARRRPRGQAAAALYDAGRTLAATRATREHVDPRFLDLLFAYEDKRFAPSRHRSARAGPRVRPADHATPRHFRRLDPDHAGGAAARAAGGTLASRKASSDGARDRNRTLAVEGRHPCTLS